MWRTGIGGGGGELTRETRSGSLSALFLVSNRSRENGSKENVTSRG